MENGLPFGDSPLDFEDPAVPGLGWASVVIFGGSALLAFLNSHAIQNWSSRLDLTDTSAPIVMLAEKWHDETGKFGLNIIVDTVKQAADKARHASWPLPHEPASDAHPADR